MVPRWAGRLETARPWVLPAIVAIFALVIRLWVLFEQRSGNPLFRLAILDDGLYLDLVEAGVTVERVGDALAPRRAHAAVIDGERVGAALR